MELCNFTQIRLRHADRWTDDRTKLIDAFRICEKTPNIAYVQCAFMHVYVHSCA